MGLFARRVKSFDLFSGHAWYVPGIGGMFVLLAWFLLGALLSGLIMIILKKYLSVHFATLVSYPLQFLPAMVFAASQSRKNMLFDPGYTLNNKHFSPYGTVWVILLTVVTTFAMMFFLDLPNTWNLSLADKFPRLGAYYDSILKQMDELLNGPFWSTFLMIAIMAPFFEEWLCRGMVLRGLLTKMKPGWAIVVSALFFAVIHANPLQGLSAFLMGLVMGYIYYKTGSLLLTMTVHFVNNGTAAIVSHMDRFKEMQDQNWIDVLGKQQYVYVFIGSCLVLAACLWVFSRIKKENAWGNIDRIPPADETVF